MKFRDPPITKSPCVLLFNLVFFLLCFVSPLSSAFNLTTASFEEILSPLFGDGNLVRAADDRSARLLLDQYTGSGFISSNMYQHGFFSAMIKLPADYTAGIVVAFYTSNGDVFEKNHDELDFEFLGNIKGKPWRFQTNLYGNGSTHRGREERYRLWFDPSREFHRYSILWNPQKIIFWVDDVPIREVIRKEEMGGEYPQKPMSLYATIWDGSDWATSGGRFKANYKYAPFVTQFKSFAIDGCPVDPIQQLPSDSDCSGSDLETKDYSIITTKQRAAMRRFRQHYMYYSYCYDAVRYPEPLPECVAVSAERERFQDTGRLKFGGSRRAEKAAEAAAAANRKTRRRGRRRSRRIPVIASDPDEIR